MNESVPAWIIFPILCFNLSILDQTFAYIKHLIPAGCILSSLVENLATIYRAALLPLLRFLCSAICVITEHVGYTYSEIISRAY
jgi:hypothetical protein